MSTFSSFKVSKRSALAAVWITIMLLMSLPLQVVEAQPQSPATSLAASSRCEGDGIYLYEHSNYGGRCRKWTADDNNFTDDNFNDMASSIRFVGSFGDGKYAVILFADAGKRGVRSAFGADDPNLGDNKIGNDTASSIKIGKVPQCVGDGIYLYENKDFGGRCRKFTSSYDDMSNTGFEDIASSVKLVGTYGGGRRTVRLCAHPGYNGACTSFSADDPNFRNDEIGHDRTSSLQITFNMRWPVGEPNGAGFGVYGATFLEQVSNGRGQYVFNPGIDIVRDPGRSATGQPVYAAYRGRVVAITPGASIIIEHTIDSIKVWTLYSNVNPHKVKVGDWVTKGQQIGTIKVAFLRFAVSYQQPSGEVVGQDCKTVQAHYQNPFLWIGTAGGKTTAVSCP
jgi:Peptidase family M23